MMPRKSAHQAKMGSETAPVHQGLCPERAHTPPTMPDPVATMVQGWHQAGLEAHTSGFCMHGEAGRAAAGGKRCGSWLHGKLGRGAAGSGVGKRLGSWLHGQGGELGKAAPLRPAHQGVTAAACAVVAAAACGLRHAHTSARLPGRCGQAAAESGGGAACCWTCPQLLLHSVLLHRHLLLLLLCVCGGLAGLAGRARASGQASRAAAAHSGQPCRWQFRWRRSHKWV